MQGFLLLVLALLGSVQGKVSRAFFLTTSRRIFCCTKCNKWNGHYRLALFLSGKQIFAKYLQRQQGISAAQDGDTVTLLGGNYGTNVYIMVRSLESIFQF
jgi:hypothetical protein